MFIIDLRIKVKFNAITEKIPCGLKILTFQQGQLLIYEAQYKLKIYIHTYSKSEKGVIKDS